MADNPNHYHAIQKMTAAWRDYMDAIDQHAINTEAERERAQRAETRREAHATDKPNSPKGG